MASSLNHDWITDAAMKLPPDRWAALAERLWMSLEDVCLDDRESPWDNDIARRIEAARKDPSRLVDGDEVLKELEG